MAPRHALGTALVSDVFSKQSGERDLISMIPAKLPLPPEILRVWVGPFSNPDLFERSGDEMVQSIVALCKLSPDSRILEVGCGCGRLARAFASYLGPTGSYEGFDVAPALIDWCRKQLQPLLSNFGFSLADVHAAGHNPTGAIAASAYQFPFPSNAFDVAVVSSVFTHMLAEEIENYVAQLARVLKPDGRCFITALLFDGEAERAVAQGTTIFDFRHLIGPCLAFDRECPQEGIACPEPWLAQILECNGFWIELIQRGDWRQVRSYEVSHDIVVARRGKG
jgi:ubiquinone/menaquinone biosynthesis C-methylase UbiE